MGLSQSEIKDLALSTYQVFDPSPPKRILDAAFNLNRQNLYYYRTLEEKDNDLRLRIEELHKLDDTLGCHKLAKLLEVFKNRVFRVMLKYGINPRKDTPAYKYPGKADDVVNNKQRELNEEELQKHTVLVSDLLQFRLLDRTWVYCCFIIQKTTRQVLSFTYGTSMKAELVQATLSDLNRIDLIQDLSQKPVSFTPIREARMELKQP